MSTVLNPLDRGASRGVRDHRAGASRVRTAPVGIAVLFAVISALALAAFAWPLVVPSNANQNGIWVSVAACLILPVLAVLAVLLLERGQRSRPDAAKFVAMLGVLSAAGAVVRLFGSAAGGIEAVFVLLIVGGAAFGPRFGFLQGMVTIGASALVFGLVGPWTPFQMFAAAWVGAGAGAVSGLFRRIVSPRSARVRRGGEIAALIGYGIIAAYLYGALLNLWFWPFAVGSDTSISYEPGADIIANLSRFGIYTLVTSTATWDTVRAITTTVGLALVGPALLAALRRTKLGRH